MNNTEYLLPQYKFKHQSKANEEAIISGLTYRFTILTSSFIRMEYSKDGIFRNEPTEIFWNRYSEDIPHFNVVDNETTLEIHTDSLVLIYEKEQAFTRKSLMIKRVTHAIHGTGVWRYGLKPIGNLGGTYRTLDEANGRVDLDDGLFSSEGYTIIDDSQSMTFDKEGWFSPHDSNCIDLYYFGYGNNFKQGLKDFYNISGKTPLLPRYALGNWWSRYWDYSDVELEALVTKFEELEIPLSVCIIDMDWHTTHIDPKYGSGWTGYSWNRELFKNPELFLNHIKAKGIATSLNLHPALGIRGHEDCYNEFAEFMDMNVQDEEMIPFDLTDPKFMKGYFEYAHHPHEKLGVDFWWIDWQQGNNSSLEGIDPLFLLNHYHFMDHGRNKDIRPFIFSRWAGLGSHKYPIGFSGDTVISWDMLNFLPEFTLTAANVGYGWWSHDIGGHFHGVEEDELYVRWIQFGVFSPIMRLHTSKNYYNKREPWRFLSKSTQIVKEYMNVRHKLIPYLYSMNKTHSEGGIPLVAPLYYNYPNENHAYGIKDQYCFGSELMVAPYLEAMDPILKSSKRKVWFPKGLWFDYFNGKSYEGDKTYIIYGDLEDMPVFARAGAIIPIEPTIKGHGVGNPCEIQIDIFPGAENDFVMYEDDGLSNTYKDNDFCETRIQTNYIEKDKTVELQIIISQRGELSNIPENRTWNIKLRSFAKVLCTKSDDIYEIGKGAEGEFIIRVEQRDLVEPNGFQVVVEFDKDYINHSFSTIDDIMKILDRSYYPISEKTQIGFVYNEFKETKGGVLGEDSDVLDKIQKVIALDIESDMKELVISLLTQER